MKLDIGCGHNLTGDVNVDLVTVKTDKFFVKADAHNLPFRNQSFESAYSSHMMEHLLNPIQALKEMRRVASKVELRLPSIYSLDLTTEHLYSWNIISFTNFLKIVFAHVDVRYTQRWRVVQGRIGKYFRIVNLILSKLGIHGELRAVAW